ncbi:MAG: DHH family phosphoesterase [Clostridia bacterium]|nr:DHH family phosphoesterase [Clostridia bacterium]
MTDVRPLSRAEVLAALDSLRAPAVLMHRSPDGDAVGSAVAAVRYLRSRGVAASLYLSEPIPERLSFLAEGVPIHEGEAREILCVDIASLSQTGAAAPLVEAADTVLSIDHHGLSTPFSPYYTVAEASSVGEVLYELFSDGGTRPLPPALAAPLFAAIASDTGGFRFKNATPAAHLAAAALLSSGIDGAELSRRLFDVRTDGELRAIAAAITESREYYGGRLSLLAVSRELLERHACTDADFDAVIDTLRSRRGVEIAAVIRERADGTVRLSMRAVTADVSALCASFGGGGHRLAAGATLPAGTAEEGEALVLQAAARYFAE